MHTNQDRGLIGFTQNVLDSNVLPSRYIFRTFTSFNAFVRVALLPLGKHPVIIGIFFERNGLTFLFAPADFIETRDGFEWNSQINKWLHRLLRSFQGRSINLIKGDVLVGLKKRLCLSSSFIVDRRINTAALNNALKVKISLSVTYNVNFFGAQFSVNLARLSRQAGAKLRIY